VSLVAALQGIRTALQQAKVDWDAVPGNYPLSIEYDNRSFVDLAALTTPYLMADVVWHDGQQLDLGPSPLISDYGSIVLAAGVKQGGGSFELVRLLEFIRPYLQMRDDIGPVRTNVAALQKPTTADGYYYQPMLVPFWVTSASAPQPYLGMSGISQWKIVNADYAALPGEHVLADTSASAIKITLPDPTALGAQNVVFIKADALTHALSVSGNGHPIMGLNEDMSINLPYVDMVLIWTGTTWSI
jgi:hypothetical protein